MKKVIRNLAAITLAGAMMMGTGMTAYAADVSRDTTSKFTNGPATNAEANTGIESFNLIKDYDSVNKTKPITGATEDNAPNSVSPEDKFTYTITPYAVWNAGSTYSGSNQTGTATPITVNNMPMLSANSNLDKKYTATPNGTNSTRKLEIEQSVGIGAAKYGESAAETANAEDATDMNAVINLPTYDTVGDYWYQVVESHDSTTGVIYGTNDSITEDLTASNGAHNATYYIHVQVTETSTTAGTSTLVRNVTMHNTAPTELTTGGLSGDAAYNANATNNHNNKVNAIENKYYAGDLVIKKEVTGNAGDKDEYFEVTVTFTKPAGTYVNSDITFTAMFLKDGTYSSKNCTIKGQYDTSAESIPEIIHWSVGAGNTALATATTTFYVKDNTTVTFSNIPYGINYEIKEKKPENDTYKNKMTFDAEDSVHEFDGVTLTQDSAQAVNSDPSDASDTTYFTNKAVGSISDERDVVTIENNKVNTIDIGVLLSNTPYIALLGVAGAGAAVLARRKRRIEE